MQMEDNFNANTPTGENNQPKLSFGQFLLTTKKKAKKLGITNKKMLLLLDIKEWISSLIFAVVAVLLLITFIARVITVDGSSMYPTLNDGERLFVTAYDVRFGSAPARGDAVICHYPGRTNKWLGIFTVQTDFVKRVVGIPGDTIKREYGVTYVNGVAVDPSNSRVNKLGFYSYSYEAGEDGTLTYYRTQHSVDAQGNIKDVEKKVIDLTDEQTYLCSFDYTYTLGDDEYFVVGDNRYNSHDSRDWKGFDNDESNDVGPISKSMIIGRVREVIWPLNKIRPVEAEMFGA